MFFLNFRYPFPVENKTERRQKAGPFKSTRVCRPLAGRFGQHLLRPAEQRVIWSTRLERVNRPVSGNDRRIENGHFGNVF